MNQPSNVITLKINGREVSARADETILQIARENDILIPTLCELDGLSGWGGCRLCLVEIAGTPKLLPACVTRVAEGMDIQTDTPRLQKYRRMTLEMLFAERNHICAVCVSNGHCELQAMAQRLGITHIEMPYRYPDLDVDASHDLFRLDHNRCVLCTRCVRVCDEIEGAHTWDVSGRGIDCKVITDLKQPWEQSETCTTCGKCVRVCPTGALTRKGTGVAEMEKDVDFLLYISSMRGRTK
ncbi:MAG TPA: bidirectional hydrogenase complex protein HoxU [Tepidisphaeraceae bacterium]|nr:bidirectional hydrogenase complex protein HoxU [Tepidisphaeraceae bacterium]